MRTKLRKDELAPAYRRLQLQKLKVKVRCIPAAKGKNPGKWTGACELSPSMDTFSRWSLNTDEFLYKNVRAWNFGRMPVKEQVVAECRDRKWQVLLYMRKQRRLIPARSPSGHVSCTGSISRSSGGQRKTFGPSESQTMSWRSVEKVQRWKTVQ